MTADLPPDHLLDVLRTKGNRPDRGRAAVREWDKLERAYEAAEKAYDWQGQRAAGARLEKFAKALKADRALDGVLRERGRELGIAETTVKVHVQSILRKLELASRVQVAGWALRHKLDVLTK